MGYALFKAKSSKKLKKDGFEVEDESVEAICSQYVHSACIRLDKPCRYFGRS